MRIGAHVTTLSLALLYAGACSRAQQTSAPAQQPAPAAKPAAPLPQPAFSRAAAGGPAKSIADVAESSLQAVVNIAVRKVVNAPLNPHMMPFHPQFQLPRKRHAQGLGSGVMVGEEGIVLTNNHVIEDADAIHITLADGRELEADLAGSDPKSDLAVLHIRGQANEIKALGLKVLQFADSSRLRMGDIVIAIGNPFGVGQTVTMGIVSAKGRANMGIVDYEDFIQTDAAINPGNSGGALINMEGRLVGINTAILSRSGGYQGIGFAIPASMARPIMESLLKYGRVVRGWLGVMIQDINEDLAQALGIPPNKGVLVADVTAGSPAERAGIARGDVLLTLDGKKLSSAAHLRNLVADAGKGAHVVLRLARGRQQRVVKATLTEMPGASGVAKLKPSAGVLGGLTVVELTPETRQKHRIPPQVRIGVVVERVARHSPAASAGMQPGDVIVELNRKPVHDPSQFAQLYNKGQGKVLLLVYREGTTLYLLIEK